MQMLGIGCGHLSLLLIQHLHTTEGNSTPPDFVRHEPPQGTEDAGKLRRSTPSHHQ